MQSTMMSYPLTLTHLLERAGRYFPKVEIVSRLPDGSIHRSTYRDFHRRAKALAEALTRAAGLKRGDRVATLMWNHYAHLEAFFGIPAAGGVVHTLNLRLAPDDIAYIANHAEDRFLIVDDALLPLLERFKSLARFERIFVVPLAGGAPAAGYENYEQLLATASGNFTYPELDENEPIEMCYTSGTTGRPRGVIYSHRSTVLHAYNAALAGAIGGVRDVALAAVPMFHANAWGFPHAQVLIGAKQVMPGPKLDAVSLLDLFEGEEVTVGAGVPTIWLGVLEALDREPKRWRLSPRLQLMVGGSAVPESMLRGFDRHGITIVHAWGMTETSPLATVAKLKPHMDSLPEDERYAERLKQGVPLPFVELRVRSEGADVAPDGKSIGEVQVRGPYITGRYYKLPPDSDKFTADGWLRTGDVATLDAEGSIKITDRIKDLIKSGGEWISSVDLENALMGHPAVAEAAVIAIPDPKWDERPLAVIVLKKGAHATPDELREFLLERKFAKWWLPDEFAFVAEIPRTSTGKFLKSKLRDEFRDRAAARAPANVAQPADK